MRTLGSRATPDNISVPDYLFTICCSAASSARAWDWPTGAKYANFGSDCNFFVNFAGTGASMPSSSIAAVNAAQTVTTGTSNFSELNPSIRQIPGGSTGGSLISPSTGIVTIGIYAP